MVKKDNNQQDFFINNKSSCQSEKVITSIDIGSDKVICFIGKIDNILEEKKIAKMLLQIHDELIFECLKKDENNVKKLIQNAMVSVSSSEYHKFSIPLEVGVNSGNNWGEAH